MSSCSLKGSILNVTMMFAFLGSLQIPFLLCWITANFLSQSKEMEGEASSMWPNSEELWAEASSRKRTPEGWSDGRMEREIYRMRRRVVRVKSCRECGHQGAEGDGGREREEVTATSKIKVCLDQCHDCTITSEQYERDRAKKGCCLYKTVIGNTMPQLLHAYL